MEKWVTFVEMGQNNKKGSNFKKWAKPGKNDHAYKNGKNGKGVTLKNQSRFKKQVTVVKMIHTQKRGNNCKNASNLKKNKHYMQLI